MATTTAGSVGRRDSGAAARHDAPLWFNRVIIIVGSTTIGFGGVGLALADTGHYRLSLALSGGILAFVIGVAVAVRYRREPGATSRQEHWAAAGMCVVAVGLALWNGLHSAHHVAANRDPGVYAITGKWISEHGGLIVHVSPTWQTDALHATGFSGGMYTEPGNTLQFQFAHFVPALLAEANGLGGDALMFRVPALLGSLALCAIYCVGRRLTRRPWVLLAAVAGFGVSLPQIQVARDTFSETGSQLLLWAGLAVLLLALDRHTVRGRYPLALTAGATLGATMMAHIDAPAFFIFLPLLAVVGWLAWERPRRRDLLAMYGLILLGGAPPAVLGTLDLQRRAGAYYHDLHAQLFGLYKSGAVVAVIALVLLIGWPLVGPIRQALQQHRAGIGQLAAAGTAVVLILAWAVRPAFFVHAHTPVPLVAAIQRQEGVMIDANRTYSEQSMVWMSWYLGPVALALAIGGLAILVHRLVRTPSAPIVTVLGITGTLTAIYLYQIHITPDQLWATRRFVTASMPLLALAAAVGLETLGRLVARASVAPAYRHSVLAMGSLALIAFPLGTTWPIRALSTQAGELVALKQVCTRIGPDSAVLFASQTSNGVQFPQSTSTWCNVPAATLTQPATQAQLLSLAAAWHQHGRRLWILGANAQDILAAYRAADPVFLSGSVGKRDAQLTLDRPPSDYTTWTFTMYGSPVAP